MTFRDWQELNPAAAARELHRRVITLLPPAQQRAAIAELPSESELAARFAQAPAAVPLARVPCLVKDLFDVGGQPTFAGSTFLPEVRPTRATDGAFVQAVRRAGAVIAGKTHMHEFAYGITGENAHYGNVEHPRFPGRTTGGSSSGSAAVVAAGIVPFALGSDTGGSVRLPAAFCGLYGFRLAPRGPWISDAVPLAPSYDTAGWFTANAADLKASIAALVGLGRSDRAPRGCYLAMPGVDPDIAAACEKQARPFAAPAEPAVRDALLQGFSTAVETYNTVVAQEAWAYHQPWAERYQSRYSTPVWQRLIRAHTLTPAQIDAAQVNTAAIRALWERFFAAHDFLVIAASPAPALTPSECTLENRGRILTLTAPASIGGLPVLSVPVPLASGLTSGLQIIVNATTSPVVRWVLENIAAKA